MTGIKFENGKFVDASGKELSPALIAGLVNTANANIDKLAMVRFNSLKQGMKRDHDIAEYKRLVIENGLLGQVAPFELSEEQEAILRAKAKEAVSK